MKKGRRNMSQFSSRIFYRINEIIKEDTLVFCTKENEICKNKQCPHKGIHGFFNDCLNKTCMSDETEKIVDCKKVNI